MNVANKHECLIVGGQSDLNTLIEPNFNEEELIQSMNIPLVFAASLKNSSIEEILNYLNMVSKKAIKIQGIIINECPFRSLDYDVRQIQKIIETRTGVNVLGILPKIASLDGMKPEDWISYILGCTDVEAIFNVRIAKLRTSR